MRIILSIAMVTLFVCLPAIGHGEARTGILVDARCGADLEKDASKVTSHPVTCAIENHRSGYGIIADGKFLRFDDHGNKQARLLLRATQKESNIKVRVGGHFEGDLIKVSEIETVD